MNKKVVSIIILIMFLIGCVSEKCPIDYKIQKDETGRTRCYISNSLTACDVTNNIKGIIGESDLNCVLPDEEVSCPLACVEALK